MIDIMIDLETLGLAANASIIQIGAVAWNFESDHYTASYNQTVTLESNRHAGRIVELEVLNWWNSDAERKSIYEAITKDTGAVPLNEALFGLKEFIKSFPPDEIRLWANGMCDRRWLEHASQEIDFPATHYRQWRDYKTIRELNGGRGRQIEQELKRGAKGLHDAIADCKLQLTVLNGLVLEGLVL